MHRVEFSRVRWRMRGAWQWPSFFLAVVVEAVLLTKLPVWGDGPGDFWGGVLVAGFLNLIVVAGLAPLAGRLLRRRRPDLPKMIAADYAGTAFIVLLFCALLAGGLHNHAAIERDRHGRVVQAFAVARFVRSQAPAFVHGLARMDSLRIEDGMYRTCVTAPGRRLPLCLFVRTDQDPPSVVRDPERISNDDYRSRGGFR
jgi:hypothetical protein